MKSSYCGGLAGRKPPGEAAWTMYSGGEHCWGADVKKKDSSDVDVKLALNLKVTSHSQGR